MLWLWFHPACELASDSDVVEMQNAVHEGDLWNVVDLDALSARAAPLEGEAGARASALTDLEARVGALRRSLERTSEGLESLTSATEAAQSQTDALDADAADAVSLYDARIYGHEATIRDLDLWRADEGAPLAYLAIEPATDSVEVVGANLSVRSGSGKTETSTASTAGFGNVFVGYNELSASTSPFQDGAHFLVIGPGHDFRGFAGIIGGQGNTIVGLGCNLLSGSSNQVMSTYGVSYGVVVTGEENVVAATEGVIVTGTGGSIAYGADNGSLLTGSNAEFSSASYGTIVGGERNAAPGWYSTVLGGYANKAGGHSSTIYGGKSQSATSSNSYKP